jgi:hypothetical protein
MIAENPKAIKLMAISELLRVLPPPSNPVEAWLN